MQAYMDRKFEDHRKRIKEAKSTIDKGKPPDMPMSMRREIERKRQQFAIEKDNRLLLDRLGVAMSHKNIDNELKEKPFTSYVELQRKKEMKKIMLDNQRLLERIQHTVPSYDHVEWERDAEKRMEYLRNMTEFPDYFQSPRTNRAVSADRTRKPDNVTQILHGAARDSSFSPQPPPIFGNSDNTQRTIGHRPMLPNILQSPKVQH